MSTNGKLGPYIEFKDVSKAFGDNHVLDHVSFDGDAGRDGLHPGTQRRGQIGVAAQHHGISEAGLGPRDRGPRGHHRLRRTDLERIRKKVTMVFQNGALFDSLTVGENVAFPLRERRQLGRGADLPDRGWPARHGGRAKRCATCCLPDLSTGMKRSVAIARALAAQPECVLYDEPTTMVDPLMAQLLGDLIKRLKIQLHLTSVVVTHDMRLAKKLADRVVFLHEGKAIFFGTYDEMEKCEEPIVQEFLKLDEPGIEASIEVT